MSRQTTRQTLDSQTQSSKQADTAPSYVAAQYATGQGPHGNWAKQEGMESAKLEPGLQRALRSEPGSADDPSRVAEARFAQPRVAGRRDAELATGSAFDGLESDAAA
ncbi:hypothetical protein CDD81_976 [Ophiocordyceps australis]|uniref:Uncharacterized protein n=1 Tax=Ophiocordyceps australis TaxID=1399860 RepID=A0A2C5Y0U1_9HYPO|nr:hypothetical protein CDD81_976 [Ophiocordyceps australis]